MTKNIATLSAILLTILVLVNCKKDPKIAASEQTEIAQNSKKDIEKFPANTFARDSAKAAAKLRMEGKEATKENIDKMISSGDNNKMDRNGLPRACNLLSTSTVAKEFGVNESDISVQNGTRKPSANQNSSSCFLRWGEGGILVQVTQNPLPDEIPNWTEKYMSSKEAQGERSIVEGVTSKFEFKKFDGPGSRSLFNPEIGRYYSVYNDTYVVSVVFNYELTDRKEMRIAKRLLKEVFNTLG